MRGQNKRKKTETRWVNFVIQKLSTTYTKAERTKHMQNT